MKKQFLEYSKFIVYACKILGATLHSFEDENTVYSKIKTYLWCIPTWILYVGCITNTFIRINKLHNGRPLLVEQFANAITIINSLIQFPIVFLFTVKNVIASKWIIQELDVIDYNLKNYIKIRNSKLIYFILTLVSIFILIDYAMKLYFYGVLNALFFGGYIFGYIVSVYESFLISTVVNEIKRQYAIINLRLEKLALYINNNNFILTPKQNLKTKSTVNNIERLTGYHSQLVNITHKTYNIYQSAIFRSIVSYFMLTCLSMFEGITYIIAFYKTGVLRGVIISITLFKGTLVAMIMMWFVIQTWTTLSYEAKKTATNIHDIWSKYAIENLVDSNVNHLKLISLELLNRELKFDVYGFFPFDWTLLQAIIGALTSYDVILIQFEIDQINTEL